MDRCKPRLTLITNNNPIKVESASIFEVVGADEFYRELWEFLKSLGVVSNGREFVSFVRANKKVLTQLEDTSITYRPYLIKK